MYGAVFMFHCFGVDWANIGVVKGSWSAEHCSLDWKLTLIGQVLVEMLHLLKFIANTRSHLNALLFNAYSFLSVVLQLLLFPLTCPLGLFAGRPRSPTFCLSSSYSLITLSPLSPSLGFRVPSVKSRPRSMLEI